MQRNNGKIFLNSTTNRVKTMESKLKKIQIKTHTPLKRENY